MVRTTKSTEKSAAKPRVKKSATVEPVVEVVAAAEPVNEIKVAESVTEVPAVIQKMSEFSAKLQQIGSLFATVKNDYKTLEKQVLKEARAMDKVNAKRNKNKGSRAPSGFVKPAAISKELAKFLGKPEDTLMSRTDVTKLITAYVKEHKLQDSGNGRRINPDAKLKALLNVKASEEVTYFNLQKYMKSHFVKTA